MAIEIKRLAQHVTAYDIADELGVSVSKAYEIARSLEHIRVGRLLRVSRKVFDRYLESITWDDSTDEKTGTENSARSGGTSSAVSVSQRSAPTGRRRKSSPDGLSERQPIPFTTPRTKARASKIA